MFLKSAGAVLICLAVIGGCAARTGPARLPLEEEGEVYLYIQPFPQEAVGLRFSLEGVFAVKDDGGAVPLSVELPGLNAASAKRQRLLAAGRLLPGRYRGFSFTIKDAFLKGQETERQLLVPEKPVSIDYSFTVARRKSALFHLQLNYAESVGGGSSFSPVFSVAVPQKPAWGVLGYVSNAGSHNLSVFDKNVFQVVGVVATGRGPKGMALDQVRRRIYVALSGDDAVEVFDALTQEEITRIRLQPGDSPRELALTPDGTTLLSANFGSNTVSFIDPLSFLERSRTTVGSSPNSVLIDRNGRRAYVFNTFSNSITVVDITTTLPVVAVSTEPGPLRGQFNINGDRLYVIYELTSSMTVLDTQSFSVRNRVFTGMGVDAIKVDMNNDLIYIGKKNEAEVEIFDPLMLIPVDFMKTGEGTAYLTIDGGENNLCAVGYGKAEVTFVNLVSKRAVSAIDVGDDPYWLTVMGER